MVQASKSLLGLCAADIMSRSVVMIPRKMSLKGAARMLARADVTGAPVVDDEGRCIGVLSATDFMHWVETDEKSDKLQRPTEAICNSWQIPDVSVRENCTVEDFMTTDPVLVNPGAKIGELARMMMDAHIHRLIVIDSTTQRPIGVVSSTDILAALAREGQVQTESTRETIHEEDAMLGAMY